MTKSGFVEGQHPVEAYGNGGFRFAGMSHRGSILLLPNGVHAWSATMTSEIQIASLATLLDLPKGAIELLLVGTGAELVPLSPALRVKLREAGMTSEPMATGAAARTYNILLGEGRRVGAALLAVP